MTKFYVGNLPFTATEDAVRNLFAPHGTVEKLALINDRDTGRPRGFGFLEMSSADASRPMQALNGKDFDGRALKLNEAQDKPRSSGGFLCFCVVWFFWCVCVVFFPGGGCGFILSVFLGLGPFAPARLSHQEIRI